MQSSPDCRRAVPREPEALVSPSPQTFLVVTACSMSLLAFTWPCSRTTWLKEASLPTELAGIGLGPGLEATEREPSPLDTCLAG